MLNIIGVQEISPLGIQRLFFTIKFLEILRFSQNFGFVLGISFERKWVVVFWKLPPSNRCHIGFMYLLKLLYLHNSCALKQVSPWKYWNHLWYTFLFWFCMKEHVFYVQLCHKSDNNMTAYFQVRCNAPVLNLVVFMGLLQKRRWLAK